MFNKIMMVLSFVAAVACGGGMGICVSQFGSANSELPFYIGFFIAFAIIAVLCLRYGLIDFKDYVLLNQKFKELDLDEYESEE